MPIPVRNHRAPPPSVVSKILLLVEQVRPATAQVHNLRTPVPVLLEARALEAVEGVADALAAAHDALVLVVAEGALVADAGEGGGAHVRVAHGALAVALVAEAADGYAGLLAAHDQVAAGLLVGCWRRRWRTYGPLTPLNPPTPLLAMSGPIASAVVLPEADSPPASPATTLKRRQSSVTSVTSESAKRPRVADDADGTAAAPHRRERGRERRLFGAVLGALSQNPTTAGQKRRSEIEKRQFAQRRQEDEESEQRKAERAARRRVQRVKETRRFERQAMSARHDNMLHLAHFLHTKTEPRLYYKPWEMSAEEEDRIEDQVAQAREAMQRERDEFEERDEAHRRRARRATPDEATYRGPAAPGDPRHEPKQAHGGGNETANAGPLPGRDGETHDQHADKGAAAATDPRPAEAAARDAAPGEPDGITDERTKDADEEVVEAAEDTVIY
ncbi:peroxin 26 [Stagonosporopsis vannaccii]|nr:peroxin 26 [Stagonosporopsis vannaccii]